MPTEEIRQIAENPQALTIALMVACTALAAACAYLYRAKERTTDRFIEYIIKQNEFLNYEKKN